jgi:hypothetical protein
MWIGSRMFNACPWLPLYSIPDLCGKYLISSAAPDIIFVQTVRFQATPYPRWVPGHGSAFLVIFWNAQ